MRWHENKNAARPAVIVKAFLVMTMMHTFSKVFPKCAQKLKSPRVRFEKKCINSILRTNFRSLVQGGFSPLLLMNMKQSCCVNFDLIWFHSDFQFFCKDALITCILRPGKTHVTWIFQKSRKSSPRNPRTLCISKTFSCRLTIYSLLLSPFWKSA